MIYERLPKGVKANSEPTPKLCLEFCVTEMIQRHHIM
jgi:hypothetical protein